MPELEQYVLYRLAETDEQINKAIQTYNFSAIMKLVHDFCNDELSSFYFDIRKDRLYCDRPDSTEWKACRTVINTLFEWLVKRIAPVLSFTAEEAWRYRPIKTTSESIHLEILEELPDIYRNVPAQALAIKWHKLKNIREVVLGAIEPHRASKEIGSSLEAAPEVYLSEPSYQGILTDKLAAEICITSQATVTEQSIPSDAFTLPHQTGVGVIFKKAEGKKCQRCWKILPEVGSDPDYPDLSPRDADAMRWYVEHKSAA